MMGKRKEPAIKKITDLREKLEAYRASALAAGKGRSKGLARVGNLALASAAAGGAALAIAPAAEAVIQHVTGPDLPQVLIGVSKFSSFTFDVDGDGDYDLQLTNINSSTFNSVRAFNQNGAQFITSNIGSNKALNSGYNIGSTLPSAFWANNAPLNNAPQLGFYYSSMDYYGQFAGAGNKYIGIRFNNAVSGQLHYGWVQVNVAFKATSVTIVDWAWEDTPGASILAGDTGAPQQAIPTLNEWGIIVLMTLLAGAAAWKMNKPEILQA